MNSSTPVTVTVCATFQFAAVNVNEDTLTVPSAVLDEVTVTVTGAVGWLVKTTVKEAFPPASVVTRPEVGDTTMPAVSSSRLVTDTSGGSIAAYSGSAELAVRMIVYVWSPSSTNSSTPVIVT